jgi:HSP20 family protein
MPKKRDPFANLHTMRREMDELFGDVWSRAGFGPRHRAGFRPRIDVYYCDDPPTAVVKADLAGVNPDDVSLEMRGRTLVITGRRSMPESEARVYHQIEIEQGHFVREIELAVNVDASEASATYEAGLLIVRLPLVQETKRVPISGHEPGGDGDKERSEQ